MSNNETTKNNMHWVEYFWEKYSSLICLLFGIACGLFHYFGFFNNVRLVTANVVNFASIVIGVTGVFLTLMITLKESDIFQRLKEFFPTLNMRLYLYLRNQIYFSLVVVILSLVINALPEAPYKILASIGVAFWSYFYWRMTIGAFFVVKIVTDLIVRDVNIPKRKARE